MRFTTLLIVSLASLATSYAHPEPDTAGALNNCGYPNGNCYDNDCHGELSANKITCTSVTKSHYRVNILDAHADTDVAGTSEGAMRMAAMAKMVVAPTTISAALAIRAYPEKIPPSFKWKRRVQFCRGEFTRVTTLLFMYPERDCFHNTSALSS
ncbi:hypothetical protein FQN49_004619 [Arthroderma sp. PD_2]|nr:hypothetical protein FQN49_004619 [Arthroderma sp. PD_2]